MATVDRIVALGGVAVEFEPIQVDFSGFGDLLSADMQIDLAGYLREYASQSITQKTVEEIVAYNEADSTVRIPYGHGRFKGMLEVQLSDEEHAELKEAVKR